MHLMIKSPEVILIIKPPMDNILRFNQEENIKQALKHKSRTCHQFSFINPNHFQAKNFTSYLKQLKSLKCLTLDLLSLLQIPEHYISKIFHSLRYLKNLSVINFQITQIPYPLYESNFDSLCKTLLSINDLFRVQVKFSLNLFEMNNHQGLRLSNLLERMGKLERFTFANLTFRSALDIAPILEAIEILRASKSLIKFSLSFEECELCPCVRLHELFRILKEIKPLQYSEIFFKECDLPDYERLKSIIPFVEEVAQNTNLTMTFESYRHAMTQYERLFFTKAIENIKSPHKIQVYFIENFRVIPKLKSLWQKFSAYCRNQIGWFGFFLTVFTVGWILGLGAVIFTNT